MYDVVTGAESEFSVALTVSAAVSFMFRPRRCERLKPMCRELALAYRMTAAASVRF